MSLWVFEFGSLWVYEFMSFWVYEFLSLWVFEFVSLGVFEFVSLGVFEFGSLWVYEFVSLGVCEFGKLRIHWILAPQRGRKYIAQGIALGNMPPRCIRPERAKDLFHIGNRKFFCPYRAWIQGTLIPRAMPWAMYFLPLRGDLSQFGNIIPKQQLQLILCIAG